MHCWWLSPTKQVSPLLAMRDWAVSTLANGAFQPSEFLPVISVQVPPLSEVVLLAPRFQDGCVAPEVIVEPLVFLKTRSLPVETGWITWTEPILAALFQICPALTTQ